jgi:ribonuclease D
LVEHADDLAEVVEALTDQPEYAVDTEFHRERTYFAQLALVQIGWPGRVVLIDPTVLDLTPLASVFAGDGLAIMHAARQDLEILERATGAIPTNLVDTQLVAGFLGYTSPSLASMIDKELGIRLPKADRLTDWLKRPLSQKQIRYAASDVEYLVTVYDMLAARIDENGRRPWLDEAMREMLAESRGPRDPNEVWRRIKEIRHLRGADLSVARAVAAWREERAIELDITPRFVLSDLGVVGVAVSRPKTVEDLRAIRGVDGRSLRSDAAKELLSALQDAIDDPPKVSSQRNHRELPADLRPALPLISAWVSQQARDLEIELALLATRADIEAFLRGDADARLAHGWRGDLAGEPIKRLLQGAASLAFDGGRLVLEDRS